METDEANMALAAVKSKCQIYGFIILFFFSVRLKIFTIKSLQNLNGMWYPRPGPGTKKSA